LVEAVNDCLLPQLDGLALTLHGRDYTGKVGAEDVDGFDTAYRVLADHIRTLTIAISDGGMPDSVGRGYVLRLILRRAIRFSKKINAPPNLMSSLVPVVVELLGDFFTDLSSHAAHVQEVLDREEALFRRTLVRLAIA
jgi:alanyl-tRNA synthetase